jgi:hypothetical protein
MSISWLRIESEQQRAALSPLAGRGKRASGAAGMTEMRGMLASAVSLGIADESA